MRICDYVLVNANANPAAKSAPLAHVVRTATVGACEDSHVRRLAVRTIPVASAGRAFGDTIVPGKEVTQMANAKTYTPKALAAEIGIDPKVLRAYLRKNHTRIAEAKNTSWIIPETVAKAARKAFEKNVASE
jgi:hypothetical protein